jgi:hypothetical protein
VPVVVERVRAGIEPGGVGTDRCHADEQVDVPHRLAEHDRRHIGKVDDLVPAVRDEPDPVGRAVASSTPSFHQPIGCVWLIANTIAPRLRSLPTLQPIVKDRS